MIIKFENFEKDVEALAKEMPSPLPEDNVAGRQQAVVNLVTFLVTL
jgi:hypothetical protein